MPAFLKYKITKIRCAQINIPAGKVYTCSLKPKCRNPAELCIWFTVRGWEHILIQVPRQYYIPSNSIFHTLLPNLIFKDLHNPFISFWILASILLLLLAIQPTLKYLCALREIFLSILTVYTLQTSAAYGFLLWSSLLTEFFSLHFFTFCSDVSWLFWYL